MRTADIAKLKGCFKNAMLGWVDQQMEDLLPTRFASRGVFKNAARNIVARYEKKIDSGIDAMVLLFGDTEGNLDSDALIDAACDLLHEMPLTEYTFGPFKARIGKGEVCVQFPHNFISEIFAGELNGVRFTIDDIKEIKEYF